MTGTGTQTDPYIVMDYTDFCNMTSGDSTYYKLGADIDFAKADRKPTDNGISINFAQLDGDGHTVSNFFRRVDVSNYVNSIFRYGNGAKSMILQNIYFKGIYLSGGTTYFISGVSTSYNITLKNCRIALKINDTSGTSSGSPAFFNRTKLIDSEILIEGTSDYIKSITNSETYGCLFRFNMTFFNTGYTNTRTIFDNNISFCGITGNFICKDSSAARYILVTVSHTVSNSYFALEFDNIYSLTMTSNFSGINFYDKEVMANAVSKMPVSDHFLALTTEQCKSAEYLQSIDFPCTSGDSV